VSEAARPAPRDAFAELLAAGEFRIGEVLGQRRDDGAWVLLHRDDAGRGELKPFDDAEAAAEIARFDDGENFRPLKTAPNLRHGWRLVVPSAAGLRLAIEHLYPGRLAALAALKNGKLAATPFRGTLARQTGMYRVAAKINDEEADRLIGNFCRSDGGCLRTILWTRDSAGTVPSTKLPPEKYDPAVDQLGRGKPTAPLLCQEICNLLVAEARTVVKASGRSSRKGPSSSRALGSASPPSEQFTLGMSAVCSGNVDSRFRLAFSNVTLFSRSRIWLRSSL
jgi:sirohydrochlorin cobaltochelatase